MRKIFCALLTVFLITPCMANVHIMSDIVGTVVKQKISDIDAQVAAIAEYNAQIENAGGNSGIPADGIWQVCKAAGWDISTTDGKAKCEDFVNTLIEKGTFYATCGKDASMVQRGIGRCVDDVFSNSFIGGISVNGLVAVGLAKEYARVHYKEQNLICKPTPRQTTLPPDDYIQCISMDQNMAYEFRFDSVTSTSDSANIDNGISAELEEGVCKIYGLQYSLKSDVSEKYRNGDFSPDLKLNRWAACETLDYTICDKVNESMSRFGRSAKIDMMGPTSDQRVACVIKNIIGNGSNLRTAFGINNDVFMHVPRDPDIKLQQQVCDYVKKTVTNPQITSCNCNDGFTPLRDSDLVISRMLGQRYDVLTCYINGEPVDFAFESLTGGKGEHDVKKGDAGMDCVINTGGKFDGKYCKNLDRQKCLDVSGQISGGTDWDEGANKCVLKDARYAQRIDDVILVTEGVALVVATSLIGEASVPVLVALTAGSIGTDLAFFGLERLQETRPHHRALSFMKEAKNCKNSSCAQKVIQSYATSLDAVFVDLNDDEAKVVLLEFDYLSDMMSQEQFNEALDKSTLQTKDYLLNYAGYGLMALAFLGAPEQIVFKIERIAGKTSNFIQKLSKFAEHASIAGTVSAEQARIANFNLPRKEASSINTAEDWWNDLKKLNKGSVAAENVKLGDAILQKNDIMSNSSLYDNMLDELVNTSSRYNAFIPKGADDFELLAEKFGIEQYFGSYKPRNVDEATQILHRIQDQLDKTEQILNKYVDALGGTDDYFRSRKIFEQDKDVAEDYIRYLNDYVKRGGFSIEGVVSELSERAGYEAMELTPERRFGIIQEFGGVHPYAREGAIARLHKVKDVLNDTHMILSKHFDDFRNVDDWDRLLYKFKEDEEWAEKYMWYLRGFIEIGDSL